MFPRNRKSGFPHFVLRHIQEYGDFAGAPEQMTIDVETRVFYKQYDLDYSVKGNGDTVHKAENFKLNIYFDPIKRGNDISNQMANIELQRKALQEIRDKGLPIAYEAIGRQDFLKWIQRC